MQKSWILLFIGCWALEGSDATAIIESCSWSNGYGKLEGYIPGAPSTVSVTYGPVECRDACMSQNTFLCAAVNYRISDGLCELLSENNQTASVVKPFDGSWLYFIRPLCAGIWLPWEAEKGSRILGSAFTDSSETMLQDCMTRCLRYAAGAECRAINIRTSSKDKNCKLRDLRVGDDDTETRENPKWQYFNRPSWYLESSPGSTQAEIEDQGNIGYSLYIFTELRIPVDGYLVAWQYDMNTESPCTSYAAVWREMGVYSYKLISKTLLTPEQPTEAGVRFQFIQNEVIRVRSGDILAVHTEKGPAESGCAYNMVTGNPSEGGKTLIFDSLNEINMNGTINNSQMNSNLMYPALKAYVSQYLTLLEPPRIFTDESSSPGELWLRFPDLPPIDESAVIVGYKVICSTDALFNDAIPCYNDSLVSVSTSDVLLNLPDEPMIYHIAVQIVRNFNGRLLFEDKYSNTSYNTAPGEPNLNGSVLVISISVTVGCVLTIIIVAVIRFFIRRKRTRTRSAGISTSPPTQVAEYSASTASGEYATPEEPDDPEVIYDVVDDDQRKQSTESQDTYYNQGTGSSQPVGDVYYTQPADEQQAPELPPRTNENMSNRD